jgi:uncharacterized damage-inducible protein DinB
MKTQTLLAFCGALIAVPLQAQSDPISGKWGRDGATVLDLKLGTDGTVSGQVMSGGPGNMVPIGSGSFDRRTGRLKLQGEAKNPEGGAMTPYSITGDLAGDSLRVNAVFGTFNGSLTLMRQAAAPDALEELAKSFNEVHAAVAKSADLVPADRYTYRPVATVRTFGELVAHIADSYVWYCTRASGRNVEWSDAIEKGKTDKTTVTQKLRESLAVCTSVYGSRSSLVGGLINNLGHTNLHYGNMVTYLRMMGLVPPTS